MVPKHEIRNIIFDLGEVIIDVNPQRTLDAFSKFGGEKLNEIYADAAHNGIFHDFECGRVDADVFFKSLLKKLNIHTESSFYENAWNAMLGIIPAERVLLLKRLKQRYRTFLLSNTNHVHMASINRYFSETYGEPSLKDFFEKEYYSYKVGFRKPDAAIFSLVLNENNLLPRETLFLDDVDENLAGAARLGIKTLKVSREKGIIELLNGY